MITAYHINRLYECKLTGNCVAETSFAYSEERQIATVIPLSNYDRAVAYLDKEARDWFLLCLENFVNHKKHIITDDTHPQWANLKTCELALEAYQKYQTNKICFKFLRGYNHFVGILPHPNNNSFASSEHDLKELKNFCEDFLKFKPFTA